LTRYAASRIFLPEKMAAVGGQPSPFFSPDLIPCSTGGEIPMRNLQVAIFVLGVLCFLAAVAFVGQDTGDTLWRAGVAAMLVDAVCTRLWPGGKGA